MDYFGTIHFYVYAQAGWCVMVVARGRRRKMAATGSTDSTPPEYTCSGILLSQEMIQGSESEVSMAIVTKISRSRRVSGVRTADRKAAAHRGVRRRVACVLNQADSA